VSKRRAHGAVDHLEQQIQEAKANQEAAGVRDCMVRRIACTSTDNKVVGLSYR
jgi:hypothetical protein